MKATDMGAAVGRIHELELIPLLLSLVVYGVIVLLSALIRGMVSDIVWMVVLSLGGATVFLVLWHNIDWQGQQFYSFGAVLLLAGALNRLLYALDVIMNGDHFDRWPFATDDPGWALARGEVITVIGLLLVVFAWQRMSHPQSLVTVFGDVAGRFSLSSHGYWVMYLLALGLEMLRNAFWLNWMHLGKCRRSFMRGDWCRSLH